MDNNLLNLILKRYSELKNLAINDLKNISYNKWNDFNLSDPGITILEQLCFAIIDWEYRCSLDLSSILQSQDGEINKKKLLHSDNILTSLSITSSDFIKVICGGSIVRNLKIEYLKKENYIKGGYIFYVLPKDHFSSIHSDDFIIEFVSKIFYKHRGLCEYLHSVKILKPKKYIFEIELEITDVLLTDQINLLTTNLIKNLQNFLSPDITGLSASEPANQNNIVIGDLIEGPELNGEIVSDDYIKNSFIREYVSKSQIVKRILLDKHISSISKIIIKDAVKNIECTNLQCNIDEYLDIDIENSVMHIFFNKNLITTSKNNPLQGYKSLTFKSNSDVSNFVPAYSSEHIEPQSEIKEFKSIQNDFPIIYSVGVEGLKKSRLIKSDHLINNFKSYLLIYDFILAKNMNILSLIPILFSINNTENHNYFFDLPKDVINLFNIVKFPSSKLETGFQIQRNFLTTNFPKNFVVDYSNIGESVKNYINMVSCVNKKSFALENGCADFVIKIIGEKFYDEAISFNNYTIDSFESNIVKSKKKFIVSLQKSLELRKIGAVDNQYLSLALCEYRNRINRLLDINTAENPISVSELSKRISEYGFFKFYKSKIKYKKNNQQAQSVTFNAHFTKLMLLVLKYGVQEKNYSITPKNKNSFSIKLKVDFVQDEFIEIENILDCHDIIKAHDFIKSLAYKISEFSILSERLYILDHVLLRSQETYSGKDDNYSFKITIIAPSWPVRFQNTNFKKLFYDIIIEQTPAHIFVDVLWLSLEKMISFEKIYNEWDFLIKNNYLQDDRIKKVSQKLLGFILFYKN